MQATEYEFSKRNNKLLSRLSNDMRFVGIFLKVAGCMSIFGSFSTAWLDGNLLSSFGEIFTGVVSLFLGIGTIKAATFFQKITAYKGNDMTNMMKGFQQIKQIYKIEFWSFIASLIIMIGLELL